MATPPAKKVLVVEDNELNMKLFCDLLDAFGFETVESRDGLKAVDLARQRAAVGRRVHHVSHARFVVDLHVEHVVTR